MTLKRGVIVKNKSHEKVRGILSLTGAERGSELLAV